jgi:hypothetical protein
MNAKNYKSNTSYLMKKSGFFYYKKKIGQLEWIIKSGRTINIRVRIKYSLCNPP